MSIFITGWALLLAGCGSGSDVMTPLLPPSPNRVVEFQKVLERNVPVRPQGSNFPSGVAVTPDGRWLVSLGFSAPAVTLYDATTLEIIAGPVNRISCIPSPTIFCGRDTLFLNQMHAAAISPDGSMVIITGRFAGILGLALPSLELIWTPRTIGMSTPPRHVIRDRTGTNYYVTAEEGSEVVRLSPDHFTADGEPQAVFNTGGITRGIALTRDERELLVLTDNGNRLVVLDKLSLVPRLSIDLPFGGGVVVPLSNGQRAIVLGGERTTGLANSAVLPLMAGLVNLDTGLVESSDVILPGNGGFTFADGNQWVDIGESSAIVPTGVGTVTIDTSTGVTTFHPAAELQREFPPCCDIASYPSGDRVVIASADFIGDNNKLIIYEVIEHISQQ